MGYDSPKVMSPQRQFSPERVDNTFRSESAWSGTYKVKGKPFPAKRTTELNKHRKIIFRHNTIISDKEVQVEISRNKTHVHITAYCYAKKSYYQLEFTEK